VVDLPPEILLLSLELVDGLLVRMTPPLGDGGASGLLGLKILRGQGKRDRTGARTGLGRPA
jgi:hypothetical protein